MTSDDLYPLSADPTNRVIYSLPQILRQRVRQTVRQSDSVFLSGRMVDVMVICWVFTVGWRPVIALT